LTQKLPDWIEAQCRALAFFGGVPRAIVCDNLKAGVIKPLWFEPTVNPTFETLAEHYDTTVLPTRPRKSRDNGKIEGAVLIVERWILARLRNQHFFSTNALNVAIAELLEDLMPARYAISTNPARSCSSKLNKQPLGACRTSPSNTQNGSVPRCTPTITSRQITPSILFRIT
jgi:hypothetical protein